jgi:hypothetical protein
MTESLSATRSEKATGIFQCNRTEYDDGSPLLMLDERSQFAVTDAEQ